MTTGKMILDSIAAALKQGKDVKIFADNNPDPYEIKKTTLAFNGIYTVAWRCGTTDSNNCYKFFNNCFITYAVDDETINTVLRNIEICEKDGGIWFEMVEEYEYGSFTIDDFEDSIKFYIECSEKFEEEN